MMYSTSIGVHHMNSESNFRKRGNGGERICRPPEEAKEVDSECQPVCTTLEVANGSEGNGKWNIQLI